MNKNKQRIDDRKKRFKKNADRLKSGFALRLMKKEPRPFLREIFAYLRRITGDDLLALKRGEKVSENLINLYFRILEKINCVI